VQEFFENFLHLKISARTWEKHTEIRGRVKFPMNIDRFLSMSIDISEELDSRKIGLASDRYL
jgi:hypothetical protein